MEYIIAPMKGSISSRILLGHLPGFGLRHSSNGFGFDFGGPSDMHLLEKTACLDVKKLGCNARLDAAFWGSSRARKARHDGRNGGIGEAIVGKESEESTMEP